MNTKSEGKCRHFGSIGMIQRQFVKMCEETLHTICLFELWRYLPIHQKIRVEEVRGVGIVTMTLYSNITTDSTKYNTIYNNVWSCM